MKSFHDGLKFECEKCKKRFDTKSGLTFHEEVHQLKENGLVFQCSECNVNFDWKASFRKHLRKFHDGKKIEPSMVLKEFLEDKHSVQLMEERENLNQDQMAKQLKKSQKPQKGMWIVRLERLKISC